MKKIRKLNFFDKSKLKKLSSFIEIDSGQQFIDLLSSTLTGYLHYNLPLKYKFLDESFLLEEENSILGLITVNTFKGNPYKINVSQLLFRENNYNVAQQLLEFIIAHYGAIGAHTFFMLIEEKYNDLAGLVTNNCGFRQCSYEQLWKIPKKRHKKCLSFSYRRFKKSDASQVAEIYNYSLIQHFKPTLIRTKEEFLESMCSGLKYMTEYRYIIEYESTVVGYFKISTPNNIDYVMDFNYSDGYDISLNDVLYFANREIIKRTKKNNLYIKIKNYINTNECQKKYFEDNGFECVQTKLLFVKDFFKQEYSTNYQEKFMMLGGVYNNPSY